MRSIARIRRLLELVEVLQSGQFYNTNQLSQRCKISRRTIFRDIKVLQQSGLNVKFDEHKQGYHLVGNRYLKPTDFTVDEALSLIVLCNSLSVTETGIPFQEPAQSAVLKLQSNLPEKLLSHIGDLVDSIDIHIDSKNHLEDSEFHFEVLKMALSERKSVRIKYRSFTENKDIQTLLSIYRLFFRRRSWYVVGRSSIHREVRIFNIGRIVSAELTDRTYKVPVRFSIDKFLGNAWNLIRGEKTYEVAIRFLPKVAENVAEVQWHKTQKIIRNNDGSIDFHVTVDGVDEISWWILGYGDQAEVIEPKELRQKILDHAKNMMQTYR